MQRVDVKCLGVLASLSVLFKTAQLYTVTLEYFIGLLSLKLVTVVYMVLIKTD